MWRPNIDVYGKTVWDHFYTKLSAVVEQKRTINETQ